MKGSTFISLKIALISLSLLGACRTADFRSVPNEKLPVTPKTEEVKSTGGDTGPSKVTVTPPPALNGEAPSAPREILPTIKDPDEKAESLGAAEGSVAVRGPLDVEEVLMQNAPLGTADILIVIDDSESMAQEQRNLGEKLDKLLQYLKGVDWQIGVITTSAKKSGNTHRCELKLITSKDRDAQTKFLNAVQAGISGAGNEQGILQAVVGLKCPEQKWIRSNSTVAVLIVSDEDNCGDGEGCRNDPSASENYLIQYVEKDLGRVVGRNAGFYGIYSPVDEPCDHAVPAEIYQRLIDYKDPVKNRANFGKICDASYGPTLERISKNIADLLASKFTLKALPISGSLKIEGVKTDGTAIVEGDYKLEGTSLQFAVGKEPKNKTNFTVRYKVPRPD